jgi:hypothetical protein
MGTLTIEFGGICIHMTQMQPYRIITPVGSIAGSEFVLTPLIQIPGNVTLPCLPPASGGGFLLQGATFTIGSPSGPGPSVDIECTTHLSLFSDTPPLNQSVVSGEQPPAAAYFDIFEGSISLNADRGKLGVSYAQLAVDFPGDEATISVRCWNGGAVQQITIPNLPQTVVVNNVPPAGTNPDAPGEFLESFLICDPMTTAATDQHLTEIATALDVLTACLQSRFGRIAVLDNFPTCSNSQWP